MLTKFLIISKQNLIHLLEKLSKKFVIFGPKKQNGNIIIDKINDLSHLVLEYEGRSLIPPKKFFLPPTEVLFEYEIEKDNIKIWDKLVELKKQKRILIGIKPCDISSLNILDKVFIREFHDPYVTTRRQNTIIVGITCETIVDTCFCVFTDSGPLVREGFDLLLTRIDESYLVEVGSEKGGQLISKFDELFQPAPQEFIRAREEKMESLIEKISSLVLPNFSEMYDIMVKNFHHEIWKELSNQCLSCGKCNFVCPTCYCFDVYDDVDLLLKHGKRIRRWDSCHFLSFTRVASGEVFRKERETRIKQRIYHKLVYSVNDIGVISCVGCGRCINVCPAGIDIREIVRELWRGE